MVDGEHHRSGCVGGQPGEFARVGGRDGAGVSIRQGTVAEHQPHTWKVPGAVADGHGYAVGAEQTGRIGVTADVVVAEDHLDGHRGSLEEGSDVLHLVPAPREVRSPLAMSSAAPQASASAMAARVQRTAYGPRPGGRGCGSRNSRRGPTDRSPMWQSLKVANRLSSRPGGGGRVETLATRVGGWPGPRSTTSYMVAGSKPGDGRAGLDGLVPTGGRAATVQANRPTKRPPGWTWTDASAAACWGPAAASSGASPSNPRRSEPSGSPAPVGCPPGRQSAGSRLSASPGRGALPARTSPGARCSDAATSWSRDFQGRFPWGGNEAQEILGGSVLYGEDVNPGGGHENARVIRVSVGGPLTLGWLRPPLVSRTGKMAVGGTLATPCPPDSQAGRSQARLTPRSQMGFASGPPGPALQGSFGPRPPTASHGPPTASHGLPWPPWFSCPRRPGPWRPLTAARRPASATLMSMRSSNCSTRGPPSGVVRARKACTAPASRGSTSAEPPSNTRATRWPVSGGARPSGPPAIPGQASAPPGCQRYRHQKGGVLGADLVAQAEVSVAGQQSWSRVAGGRSR